MKLSHGNAAIGVTSGVTSGECIDPGKKDGKGNGVVATTDKLKASNFPASVLRIGSWEVMALLFNFSF